MALDGGLCLNSHTSQLKLVLLYVTNNPTYLNFNKLYFIEYNSLHSHDEYQEIKLNANSCT